MRYSWLMFSVLCSTLLASACASGELGETSEAARCEAKVGSSSRAIIGGSTTAGHPTVGYLTDASGEAFCTATLITDRRVLTAAHCLAPITPTHFALGPSDRAPTRQLRLASVTPHPSYDDFVGDNDIGYADLAEPAGVVPVPVSSDAPTSGTAVTLVGYGVDDGRGQTGSGVKREVDVRISDVSPTTWSYRFAGGGSCNGDSGGPAFAGDTVVGVTSAGDEFCEYEGIYTRVDVFRGFLDTPPGTTPAGEPPPSHAVACENTCPYAGDGECDDGGPGAVTDVCPLGTDCSDCGMRGEEPPAASEEMPSEETPAEERPAAAERCTDTCPTANDGECDDGGSGAACAICAVGTDCADCGARAAAGG